MEQMATTQQARPGPSRTDEELADRVVFKATWAFVWNALRRYHLDHDDRKEVTQVVVIKAWHKRKQFNTARGNEQQWLSGILRNEVANLFSARSGGAGLVPLTDLMIDGATEAQSPENDTTFRQLAERALSFLAPSQAQAIVLRLVEGLTFREIAKEVGISPSTAQARYTRGMEALRRAIDEGEIDNPFSAAVACGIGVAAIGAVPPREMEERAWQHVMVALGLDEAPPDSEPPASGTHRREPIAANDGEPPPSRHPPHEHSPWPRRLGLALLLLLGPGAALDEARSGVALAADPATTIAPSDSGATEPSTTTGSLVLTSGLTVATTSPPVSTPLPAPAPQRRQPERRDNDAEVTMLDSARQAKDQASLKAAIEALGNAPRRFPRGQSAAERAVTLLRACARYRAAHPQRDEPDVEQHCAGR